MIPIHNASGGLIAYAGRAIDGGKPKYQFPAGFRKSLVLFNLHRALESRSRTVIVVEGFFDTLAVHQSGYPAVVSLMGSTLSRWQADLLGTHFDRVLLMLDRDEAGLRATIPIDDVLRSRMPVTVISIPDGRQPDQLASEDMRRLLKNHERRVADQRLAQEYPPSSPTNSTISRE